MGATNSAAPAGPAPRSGCGSACRTPQHVGRVGTPRWELRNVFASLLQVPRINKVGADCPMSSVFSSRTLQSTRFFAGTASPMPCSPDLDRAPRSYAPQFLLFEGELREGWTLEVSQDGLVLGAQMGPTPPTATRFPNCVMLPGLVNAHSHAFQRLLRGRTEFLQPGHAVDDFWSWRELMYRVAAVLEPEQLYVASRQAFLEMALAGITAVGEFHYLHRDPAGAPYSDPSELAKQVIRAARDVGLRIALLRVAYERAGHRQPLGSAQRRFADEGPGAFLDAVHSLRCETQNDSAVSVGIAPHSLRAVSRSWLERICRQTTGVIHMHVAEQSQDVTACVEEYQRRPVELLDELGLLGPNFTAVHAIHVSRGEVEKLGRSGANVCVCPSTETNLADGVAPADWFSDARVPMCLGSDSQVQVDLLAEARDLEGHLRLIRGRRAVLDDGAGRPGGLAERLLETASAHGARSLGLSTGELRVGMPADFCTIDVSHPSVAGASPQNLIATIIFGAEKGAIRDVAVSGELIVREGKHLLEDESVAKFTRLSRELGDSIR